MRDSMPRDYLHNDPEFSDLIRIVIVLVAIASVAGLFVWQVPNILALYQSIRGSSTNTANNQPQRKTLPPHVSALLAKNGIKMPDDGDVKKLDTNEISAALSKSGMKPEDRMVVINIVDRIQKGMPL